MADRGLGRDISCTTELRPGRFVSGARLVGEAIYRRLTTPRGTLIGGEEEANYGLDLTELVGATATKADAASLPGRIKAEVENDERVESVDVEVVERTGAEGQHVRAFTITISATTADGPFELVIAASAVTVDLVGLTEEP